MDEIIRRNGKGLVNDFLLDSMVADVNEALFSARIVKSLSKGVDRVVLSERDDGEGGSGVDVDGHGSMLECVPDYSQR